MPSLRAILLDPLLRFDTHTLSKHHPPAERAVSVALLHKGQHNVRAAAIM
jgi:hypothetical protein